MGCNRDSFQQVLTSYNSSFFHLLPTLIVSASNKYNNPESRQCLFPGFVSANGACSDNTGQTQILQCHPRKSVTISLLRTSYYNYTGDRSIVYTTGIPSIVFWSPATEIKSLIQQAHLADEIYSSCSKEIQKEGEIVSGKKGYKDIIKDRMEHALNQLPPTFLAIICRQIQLLC